MTDVVVTVPKSFGLATWIGEGDPAGEPWSGQEWEKSCSECREVKPASCFADRPDSRDGKRGVCRSCVNGRIGKAYRANPEPKLAQQRKAREASPDRFRAIEQRRQKNTAPRRRARAVAWDRRNPEGYRAHIALNNAVALGKVKRPDRCTRCGQQGRLDGHHADYAKPLIVEWLCRRCHSRIHQEEASHE